MDSAIYTTPLGMCRIDYRGQLLVGLTFIADIEAAVAQSVQSDFSDEVYAQLMEYIEGARRNFDIPIELSDLTPFTLEVLSALQSIPYGHTVSYSQVAQMVGRPNSARAVGRACGLNPIAIVIPCHRVVGANGSITGFAWGVELKVHLLNLECSKLCFSNAINANNADNDKSTTYLSF